MRNLVCNIGDEENKRGERLSLALLTHLAFILWAVAQMNHRSWMSFSGSVRKRQIICNDPSLLPDQSTNKD